MQNTTIYDDLKCSEIARTQRIGAQQTLINAFHTLHAFKMHNF